MSQFIIMLDVNNNILNVGDKVVYIKGKNKTCYLATGTITKIYQGQYEVECSVDNNPHILSNRVMRIGE